MKNNQHQYAGGSGKQSTAFKIGQMVAKGDWSGLAVMAGFGVSVGLLAVPFLGGAAMILAGFIVILRQLVWWLHTGNWSPMEFRAAWHAVGGTTPDLPDLRGVQKIFVWFLDQSLSLSLAVYGAIVVVLALVIMINLEDRCPHKPTQYRRSLELAKDDAKRLTEDLS